MKQDRKTPRGSPYLRKEAEARLQSKTPKVQDLSHDEISVLVHELQVHQIELEMQNDELRQGQISLEEASRKYSDFYDFTPVGFLTLDESGLIREVTLTATRQLGVQRRHLTDKSFRFFIPVEDRNRFRLYLKRVFQETGPHPCETKLQRPDGGSFFAHLDSIAVIDVSGAKVCRTSITDISDLKEAEEKLQASERLFASFVGHLPSVAVIRDLDGRCLFANTARPLNTASWLRMASIVGCTTMSGWYGMPTVSRWKWPAPGWILPTASGWKRRCGFPCASWKLCIILRISTPC